MFIRDEEKMCPVRPDVLPDVTNHHEGTVGGTWQ